MNGISDRKVGKALEALKALENTAIHPGQSRMRLELPGRIRRILIRSSKGMNLDEIGAIYANVASEYANSIIEADFTDTLKTAFWKTAEEQCWELAYTHTANIGPYTPPGYIS